jgi:hypothetical protein
VTVDGRFEAATLQLHFDLFADFHLRGVEDRFASAARARERDRIAA